MIISSHGLFRLNAVQCMKSRRRIDGIELVPKYFLLGQIISKNLINFAPVKDSIQSYNIKCDFIFERNRIRKRPESISISRGGGGVAKTSNFMTDGRERTKASIM